MAWGIAQYTHDHIAIQETLDGKSVNWLKHVSDNPYDKEDLQNGDIAFTADGSYTNSAMAAQDKLYQFLLLFFQTKDL